jgi:hypothetical protein
MKFSALPQSTVISAIDNSPDTITTKELRSLLSHGSPINQQIINLYIQLLCRQYPIKRLDAGFFPMLHSRGWSGVERWFTHQTGRRRRKSTPSITSESAIVIPCHVHGCHFFSRREIKGEVIFLYADDMNQPSTETLIKSVLSSSHPEFFPAQTKWISCHNYTYSPHSNECGIRTLLALSVLSIHPNPQEYSLLPYMHINLAQIGRAWVAIAILNSNIPHEPLQWTIDHPACPTLALLQVSHPSSIIPWQNQSMIHETKCVEILLVDSTDRMTNHKQPLSDQTNLTKSDSDRITNYPVQIDEKKQINLRSYEERQSQKLNPLAPEFIPESRCQNTRDIIWIKDEPPRSKSSGLYATTLLTNKTSKKSHNPQVPCQQTIYQFLSLNRPPIYSLAGAMDTWGHVMKKVDSSKIFRILLQNPNGLQPGRTDYDFHYSLSRCHTLGIGAISIAETKTVIRTQPSTLIDGSKKYGNFLLYLSHRQMKTLLPPINQGGH